MKLKKKKRKENEKASLKFNLSAKHIANKGLVSRIYKKNPFNLVIRKHNFFNWYNMWTDMSPKIHKWPNRHIRDAQH